MADEKWIKDPKDPNEEKPVQAVTSGPSLPDEEYSEVKPTTGNVAGETVDQFSAGKAAANSSAPVVGQQEGAVAQPDNVLTESQMIQQFGINPATGTDEVSTPSTEQGEKVTTPSIHIADWNNTTLDKFIASDEGKKVPLHDILYDYMRWGQENGVPTNPWAINDIINNSQDLKNTPEDDEKARKKAERKERFDRMGNFLLHLGNAIGNIAGGGYGAVKLEDPVQWTERQRLIKEKTDEQRRRNNESIWDKMKKDMSDQRAYEMQKQAYELKKQQDQREQKKAELENEYLKAKKNGEDKKAEYIQAQIDRLEALTPLQADTEKSKAEKNRRPSTGRSGGRGRQDSHVVTTTTTKPDGTKVTERDTTYGTSGNTKKRKSKTRV